MVTLNNKKGQIAFYGLMLGMVVIILALALAPAGKSVIDSAMDASTADLIGLDCDNASISNFTKGTCRIVDFSLAYFFGGILLIGGAIITARFAFN